MTDLSEFEFLWDGSEPGWEIHWVNHVLWRIDVLFAGSTPTLDELKKVRTLLPHLGALRAQEALQQLRGQDHVTHPEAVGNIEMQTWVERAHALGFKTKVRKEDRSGGMPMRDGHAMLIEDHDLAVAVCQRMMAAGLPVVYATEVD